MSWAAIRQALRGAAAKLKSNTVADAAIGELHNAVPVVGGFASSYWLKLDRTDAKEANELAQFLDVLGERESRFNAMRDFLQGQSSLTLDLLLERKASLDMILALVKRVDGGMSGLREEVFGLGSKLAEVADATEAKIVGTAMRVSATLIDDHASRREMIASITRDLEQAGSAVTEDTLYDMAMMFMLTGKHQLAEAALLEVHHRDGSRNQTLIALAQIYQLRAHELIIGKNFGFAEEVLEKSRGYVKVADNDANLEIDLQLAHGYKELGQAYMEAARPGDAAEPLKKARKLFAGVLAVEPRNPSALNGMGSLCIVDRNYEEAIAYIQSAIDRSPTYAAAWYDLAQASYALMRSKHRSGDGDGASRLRNVGLTAYYGVQTLRENGILLPEAAQRHLDSLYQPMLQPDPSQA